MEYKEGSFKSIRGLKIHYEGWIPEGKTKAILFLVHGVGEYTGRYKNVVNHFVDKGYAIYGLDHIGHGKSEGPREAIDKFEDFTIPLTSYYNMVTSWHPGIPVFIYGHSLGALISCYYLLSDQEKFKGAIISAPPTKVPKNISPAVILVGKILSAIAPGVGVVGLDTTSLSSDVDVVKAYENDPLVFHGKMPARLSAEMLRIMQKVSQEASKISLPIFIFQGDQDRIVDPTGAKDLYEGVGSKDKFLKYYPGLLHEVHNEPDRETLFSDMEAWLAPRI